MYAKKIIKKVPGELAPQQKKENPGYIDDLGKKQLFELQEILDRQNNLLSKKSFMKNLPDNGEKLKAFRNKILQEINHRNEVDQAAKLLSKLNIATQGKAAMIELEWTGKYSENADNTKIVELDSDDEDDPLKILAQPTGSGVHKKKIIHLPPEESLIKKEDLEDIDFPTTADNQEHVKFITDIVEKATETKRREPFKPYKTTKSNVHDPEVEKGRKKDKHWEVTAATPPLIVHGAVKTLSINESLQLEKEKADKLKEIQMKYAAERLTERVSLFGAGPMPSQLGNYRDRKESESSTHSENEVYDEDDNDTRGTIVYTVDSVETYD